MGTHYDTLGVARTATEVEIRRAYLKKARLLHPDQFVDRPEPERARAERLMKDINVAWTTLGNPTKRKVYDADLRLAAERARRPTAASAPRPTGPVAGSRPGATTSTNGAARPRPQPKVATPEEMELGGWGRLVTLGPIALVLFLLVGILVVTALATGDTPDDADGPSFVIPSNVDIRPVGCIDLVPQPTEVPCDGTQDAFVWATVGPAEECPTDIEAALNVQLDPIYRTGVGGLYCVTRTS